MRVIRVISIIQVNMASSLRKRGYTHIPPINPLVRVLRLFSVIISIRFIRVTGVTRFNSLVIRLMSDCRGIKIITLIRFNMIINDIRVSRIIRLARLIRTIGLLGY